ncbi:hypothetical protein [Spiroplasma chrysopicola]|uniref:Uncharacterized protein n=1 Tax=Spiroplasma chrysopicola DF-1 TaxID=1276227 RepID=R4U0J3_9MOLU|nr:hypothetical protein [Spiroplasma chrysopicola]AGM24772.1 hypothetical protein SCHRY_v1c01870 [Spiroplasma chrysopicola DF-1]
MNNGFYILPNDEGYLVKSYDTNGDVALFRSRRDAEVFISALTTPQHGMGYQAPYPGYMPGQPMMPMYPPQSSPQVFFIQQPAAQAPYPSSTYPFYSSCPAPGMMVPPMPINGCGCQHGFDHQHQPGNNVNSGNNQNNRQGQGNFDNSVNDNVNQNDYNLNQPPYYEQEFMANPVYLGQDQNFNQNYSYNNETDNNQSQDSQYSQPEVGFENNNINNFAQENSQFQENDNQDNNFKDDSVNMFNFIDNEPTSSEYGELSKRQLKKLAKQEKKAAKIQNKVEQKNAKKMAKLSKYDQYDNLEDLDSFVE